MEWVDSRRAAVAASWPLARTGTFRNGTSLKRKQRTPWRGQHKPSALGWKQEAGCWAAQDFRHITQKEGETVNDFIRRLEYTFCVAYGRDAMSTDTHNTSLYGQLQEGLLQEVMRTPAVSGAQGYSQLCIAAKNEEKRMAELRKRQAYRKSFTEEKKHGVNSHRTRSTTNSPASGSGSSNTSRKSCYNCGSYSHLQKDCTSRRTDSKE